jgi:hypothetical protein
MSARDGSWPSHLPVTQVRIARPADRLEDPVVPADAGGAGAGPQGRAALRLRGRAPRVRPRLAAVDATYGRVPRPRAQGIAERHLPVTSRSRQDRPRRGTRHYPSTTPARCPAGPKRDIADNTSCGTGTTHPHHAVRSPDRARGIAQRAVRIVARVVPVRAPLPHIPRHVVEAELVGPEGVDRSGPGEPVGAPATTSCTGPSPSPGYAHADSSPIMNHPPRTSINVDGRTPPSNCSSRESMRSELGVQQAPLIVRSP